MVRKREAHPIKTMLKKLLQVKARRAARTRSKIRGTGERPRLSIFRSNKFVYAQLIDDEKGSTLLSIGTGSIKGKSPKAEQAFKAGETLGEKALAKGIKAAVLDRGSYRYHGRVKAVAEGARKAGLQI